MVCFNITYIPYKWDVIIFHDLISDKLYIKKEATCVWSEMFSVSDSSTHQATDCLDREPDWQIVRGYYTIDKNNYSFIP